MVVVFFFFLSTEGIQPSEGNAKRFVQLKCIFKGYSIIYTPIRIADKYSGETQ